jgi:hypothetical protein
MSGQFMTCADCDDRYLDYFEGRLDARTRESMDAHVAACARCQGLVRDIDGIRETAASLPELAPSRDLWKGIEARIQPSVRSIGSPRPQAIPRTWLAAAAAALIVVSSSVTYVATPKAKDAQKSGNAVATGTPAKAAELPASEPVSRPAAEGEGSEAPAAPAQSEGSGSVGSTQSAPPVRSAPLRTLRSASLKSSASPTFESERATASEIARLQVLLRERRSELEPATVRTIEENLAVIDAALDQARAALARDPASAFLNQRLEDTIQKKAALLRTVALMRSST